jgi:phytoene synthase
VQCAAPALTPAPGAPLPLEAAAGLARATERLLSYAESYYRSGDAGLGYLSARCGFSIRAARLVYSEIGHVLRAQHCDPFAPRAVVSRRRKLQLLGQAALNTALRLPESALAPRPDVPVRQITEPESIFMVP